MGRTSDRSSDSSSVNVGGSMSLRVDAIWPNFTNIPPDSSRTVRSRRGELGRLERGRRRVSHVHEVLLAGVVQHLAQPSVRCEYRLDLADRVEQPAPQAAAGLRPAGDELEDDADRHGREHAEEQDQRYHDFGRGLVVGDQRRGDGADAPADRRRDHAAPESEVHPEQATREPPDREDERHEHQDVDDDDNLHRAG